MNDMTNEQLHKVWEKCHMALMDALREQDRLSAENSLKDKAIRRAIEAIETLQEEALGYGYAEGDSYRWPFRDELLDQLRASVSTEHTPTDKELLKQMADLAEKKGDWRKDTQKGDCSQDGNKGCIHPERTIAGGYEQCDSCGEKWPS